MRTGGFRVEKGVVSGYLVEGRVPAAEVRRLLLDRPKAHGIGVPGMPLGSPGMEQGPARYQQYKTYIRRPASRCPSS